LFSLGLFACHNIFNGLVKLSFFVQRAVFMVLDAHTQESIGVGLIFIHIGSRHRGVKTRESESGRNFEHCIRSRGKRVCYRSGRQVSHLFQTAYQHHVILPGGNRQDGLAQRRAAARTGIFHARAGNRRNANPAGDNGSQMPLFLELVRAEVPQIKSFDIFGGQAFFNGGAQFLIGFHEQVP